MLILIWIAKLFLKKKCDSYNNKKGGLFESWMFLLEISKGASCVVAALVLFF